MATNTDPLAKSPPTTPDRYGRMRRDPSLRRWTWLWAIVAVGVGVVLAFVGYRSIGTSPIETQRLGFAEKANDSMEITFDVIRDDPNRSAVCIVRVRDQTGLESGRREVLVPAGPSTTIKAVISSGSRPVTADVVGCSYSIPVYLSTIMRPTG